MATRDHRGSLGRERRPSTWKRHNLKAQAHDRQCILFHPHHRRERRHCRNQFPSPTADAKEQKKDTKKCETCAHRQVETSSGILFSNNVPSISYIDSVVKVKVIHNDYPNQKGSNSKHAANQGRIAMGQRNVLHTRGSSGIEIFGQFRWKPNCFCVPFSTAPTTQT